MPDDLLHTPLPDRAHEALRQAVVEAVDSLTEQVERINNAFLMLSVTADFSQAVLNTTRAATAQMQAIGTRIDAAQTSAKTAIQNADLLQTQMADALARLDALESPKAPEV